MASTGSSLEFSKLEKVNGYVPQVRVQGFTFPLLICDIDEINLGLIGWEDLEHSYDWDNMIFDVPRMREYKKKMLIQKMRCGSGKRKDALDEKADLDTDNYVKPVDVMNVWDNGDMKEESKDDKQAETEGNRQHRKSWKERVTMSLRMSGHDGASTQVHESIIENPCFHIIKHYEPHTIGTMSSKATYFKDWDSRKNMFKISESNLENGVQLS